MIAQILMTDKGLESDSWRDMRVLPSVVIVIVKAVLENIKEHHESLINVKQVRFRSSVLTTSAPLGLLFEQCAVRN